MDFRKNIVKLKWVFYFIIIFVQVFSIRVIIQIAPSAEYASFDWRIFPVIFAAFCIISDILLLFSEKQIQQRKKAKLYNDHLNNMVLLQLEHYEDLTEELDSMAKFRHDFRNYMQTVYILIERKAYDEARDMLDSLRQRVLEGERESKHV